MNKGFLLLVVCFLLMSGCHRRNSTEGLPEPVIPPTLTVPADTIMVESKDSGSRSVRPLSPDEKIQLQRDSAEITNLRIFARKQRVIYNPLLLVGNWQRGTEHLLFRKDSTGLMWDTSDDVSREEAQPFSWSMDSNVLVLVCRLMRGALVPKRYVVTYLDEESLSCSDVHGNAFLWDRDTIVRVAAVCSAKKM